MSSYSYTPANTWGTTRGGGTGMSTASSAPVQSSIAGTETALQSGWSSTLWDNPLFWLVLLLLIFMGYIMFSFTAGAKRVGAVSVKTG